jgi:hypothetical protein
MPLVGQPTTLDPHLMPLGRAVRLAEQALVAHLGPPARGGGGREARHG